MSIWTLASEGRHDELIFGMSLPDVEARFGEPTDRAQGSLPILKYDQVELHFAKNSLYQVHTEIWSADAPAPMLSVRLNLSTDELVWPLDVDAVAAAARKHGLTPRVSQRFDGHPEVSAGLAVIVLDLDAGWIGWSVSDPTSVGSRS